MTRKKANGGAVRSPKEKKWTALEAVFLGVGVASLLFVGCKPKECPKEKKRHRSSSREPAGTDAAPSSSRKRQRPSNRKTHKADEQRREPLAWGRRLLNQGRYYKAVEILKRAVSVHPEEPKVQNELAYALYLHRDYQEAFLVAMEALKRAKHRRWKSAILYNIARVFEEAPWPPVERHWHPDFLLFHAYLMRPNGAVRARLARAAPDLVSAMGTPDIDLAAKELLAARTKLCSLLTVSRKAGHAKARPGSRKARTNGGRGPDASGGGPSALQRESGKKGGKAAAAKATVTPMATQAHSLVLARAVCVKYEQAKKRKLQPSTTPGAVDLPGKCRLMIAPRGEDAEDFKEPPKGGYGKGQSSPVHKLEVDLDEDGIKDLLLACKRACDGRNNCYFAIYLSRGKCGHYVGTVMTRPGDLKVLSRKNNRLRVIQGTDAYHGGYDETRYRFDGKVYSPYERNSCYHRRCSGWKKVR